MLVLVTGANGFVGKALLARCIADPSLRLRGSTRAPVSEILAGVEPMLVGELASDTDWTEALKGVSVVVHTAARVHVMHDVSFDRLREFRRVNVAGTLKLAGQAAAAGVRRFVFISSIKVNGERTEPGRPFTPDDPPAPVGPYGRSKQEAEEALRKLGLDTGMEIVIIRPVLVYGPGVKANFLAMMRWLHRGIPLPFGAIHNRRSLVALDNLTDLVRTCLRHPAAANQTFLVSDDDDVSTEALLHRVAMAMGTEARLIPVPVSVLRAAMRLFGKAEVAERLCASLQVDIERTRQLLGWAPPVSLDEGLRRTARWFSARDD